MRILRILPFALLLAACHPDDPLDIARGRNVHWELRQSVMRSFSGGALIDSTDVTPLAPTLYYFYKNGKGKRDVIEEGVYPFQWTYRSADSSLSILENHGTAALTSYEVKIIHCDEEALRWTQLVQDTDSILTITTTDLDWQAE